MRERIVGHREFEGVANRLPPVSRLPLDEAFGGDLGAYRGVVRLERLFGGRLSPLVAHLAEEDGLDDEDIAAIEALLKELKS